MPHQTPGSIVYLAHQVRDLRSPNGTYWSEDDNMAAFERAYGLLRPLSIARNAHLVAPWHLDVRTTQDEAETMVAVAKLVPLCHELWFVTWAEHDHAISVGVEAEIQIALKHNVTVTHFRMSMQGDGASIIRETPLTELQAPRIIAKGSVDLGVAL